MHRYRPHRHRPRRGRATRRVRARARTGRRGRSEPPDHDLGGRVPARDRADRSPLETAPDGRLVVDATLRAPGDPRILVAGDCAAPPAAHLRASCAAALPMGGGAADTIASELRGDAAEPVGIGFAMRCLSIGRDAGLVEPVRGDDRPFGPAIGGRPARWVKDWIMARTTAWMRGEAARSGSFRGVRGPA